MRPSLAAAKPEAAGGRDDGLFISTDKLVRPNLFADGAFLFQDPGLYFQCSAACGLEVAGFQTAAGGALAISGQNFIPTRRKPKGSTPGTSLTSLAARKVFGKTRLPFPLPAPTTNAPFAVSRNAGAVAGRAAPVVGYGILIYDARSVDFCVASCLRPPPFGE